MVRHVHLIAVMVTCVIGCAVLLVIGCSGTGSETSNKKEQGHSPQATESEKEARCEGTRIIKVRPKPRSDVWNIGKKVDFTTYDVHGCPKGGLLLGTDKRDFLNGVDGDDEIRGLGGNDVLQGGPGSDILYGGEGEDFLDHGDYRDEGDSEDVFYGGDGNDQLNAEGGPRARLYCGEGRDDYAADKDDYVDSSCEKKVGFGGGA